MNIGAPYKISDFAPHARCYLLRNADFSALKNPDVSDGFAFLVGLDMLRAVDADPERARAIKSYMNNVDASGFGTTITLSVPGATLEAIASMATRLGYNAGVVTGEVPVGDGFKVAAPVFAWLLGMSDDPGFRQLVAGHPLAS